MDHGDTGFRGFWEVLSDKRFYLLLLFFSLSLAGSYFASSKPSNQFVLGASTHKPASYSTLEVVGVAALILVILSLYRYLQTRNLHK